MTRRDAPATGRNRYAIAEVLGRRLQGPTRVLELASGTGQHAVFFAARFPNLSWQPTDVDPEALASIQAWIEDPEDIDATGGLANLHPPIELDAREASWPLGRFDALFSANMIHISSWASAEGLFAGARRHLEVKSQILLYGPYKMGGEHTAPSNAAFDESLQRRNPTWGIRDLEAVEALAKGEGFALVEVNDLPANNKLIVFESVGLDRGTSEVEG